MYPLKGTEERERNILMIPCTDNTLNWEGPESLSTWRRIGLIGKAEFFVFDYVPFVSVTAFFPGRGNSEGIGSFLLWELRDRKCQVLFVPLYKFVNTTWLCHQDIWRVAFVLVESVCHYLFVQNNRSMTIKRVPPPLYSAHHQVIEGSSATLLRLVVGELLAFALKPT